MKDENACIEQDEPTEMLYEDEGSAESEPSLHDNDPCTAEPVSENGDACRVIRFDPDDRIIVRNLSAYWIPELRINREIGGTIYTVTGSYEGTEMPDRKLLRIMTRKMEENR